MSTGSWQRYMNVNQEEERLLFDLVSRMLEYEPTARIKVHIVGNNECPLQILN